MELVKAKGGTVSREAGPVKGGKTVIAFVEDPDGYKFELIERGPTPEPLCQVMLRVGDLDRSIEFYKNVRANLCNSPLTLMDYLKEFLNSILYFRLMAWSFCELGIIHNTR